jgi:hypothetical protein
MGFFFSFRNFLKKIHLCFKTGLPKALREALQFLATGTQIGYLTATLQDQLNQADPGSTAQGLSPELPWDLDAESNIVVDWTKGVDEFKGLSIHDIFTLLGLSDETISFFNHHQDPYGLHDPWTEEGQEWFNDAQNRATLTLCWHQQVGVTKMLMNTSAGKPILLMHGVGLGKTIQSMSLIALLTYYHGYYANHGSFPSVLGESQGVLFCSMGKANSTIQWPTRNGDWKPQISLTVRSSLWCLFP